MKAIVIYYSGKEAEAGTINNLGREIVKISNRPDTIIIHSLSDEEVAKSAVIMTAHETKKVIIKRGTDIDEQLKKAIRVLTETYRFDGGAPFEYDLFAKVVRYSTAKELDELRKLRSLITVVMSAWNDTEKKEYLKAVSFSEKTYSYLIKITSLINSYL